MTHTDKNKKVYPKRVSISIREEDAKDLRNNLEGLIGMCDDDWRQKSMERIVYQIDKRLKRK